MSVVSRARLARGGLVLLVLALMVLLVIGLLIGRGELFFVFGAVGVVVSTFVSWRWPVTATALVLLAVGGYSIFQMTPIFHADVLYIGGGVAAQDVILVGMVVATMLQLLDGATRRRIAPLFVAILAIGIWLLVAVVRNYSAVGLSALGELRFRYLLLAVPLCLLVSLRTSRQLRAALRIFVLISVALPLVLSPGVLYLHGWSFGPSVRLFPSHVSLGLLLGIIVMWRCRFCLRVSRPVLYLGTVFGGIAILVDAHRSVWLAAISALVVLALSMSSFVAGVRRVAALITAGVAASAATFFTPLDVWGILGQQGGAALAVEGTARWRQLVWEANLEQFYAAPVAGRGLGLYWSAYVPELGREITVFPHSLYVMVLVHLGVVGMVLLAWLWLGGFRVLYRSRGNAISCDDTRGDLSWLGMATLTASAAYGVAYGFDPYSLTLAGVCLGAVLNHVAGNRCHGQDRSSACPKRRDGGR